MSDAPTYIIARNGEVIFRLNKKELPDYLNSGKILISDYYWHEGMSTHWLPVSQMQSEAGSSTRSRTDSGALKFDYTVNTTFQNVPDSCPTCGSKSIKTAKAIYLAGTRDRKTDGYSWGYSRRSSGRSYSSTSTSQSRLAAKMSPPSSNFGCMVIIFAVMISAGITTLFNANLVIFLASFGLSVFALLNLSFMKTIKQEEDQKSEEYDRTWYCNKCATMFVITRKP